MHIRKYNPTFNLSRLLEHVDIIIGGGGKKLSAFIQV